MDTEKDRYAEERELLRKQLRLLAEQSQKCLPTELEEQTKLSEQMVAIYFALKC